MKKYFILVGGFVTILGVLGYAYYRYNQQSKETMDCDICGYYYKDRINHYENSEFINTTIPNPRSYIKVTDKYFIMYINKKETKYQYKLIDGVLELYRNDELKNKYSYSYDDVRLNLTEETATIKNVDIYQIMKEDAFLRMTK